jgi:hypothetical protein
MSNSQDCFGFARECEQIARLVNNPKLREQLVQMAREWIAQALAEEQAHPATKPATQRPSVKTLSHIPRR